MSEPHSRHLRKGRWSEIGFFYLLTTVAAGRRKIFNNPTHAGPVLEAIQWLDARGRFFVEAAVVMPDHLHLAGELRAQTLAQVMHSLKSYTARCLVEAGIEPPIWQDGYHDHGLRDYRDYRIRLTYLIENPVRAGLVKQIEDYPYVILPHWWGTGA